MAGAYRTSQAAQSEPPEKLIQILSCAGDIAIFATR